MLLTCLLAVVFIMPVLVDSGGGGKYSKAANKMSNQDDDLAHLKDMKNPLRMGKLNLVWEKAVNRLSDPKLKRLLTELKLQDKDELILKKLKSEGGDKSGLKEAELRKRLLGLMKKFDLDKYYEGSNSSENLPSDEHIMRANFRDKKLNKLWNKAEKSGFTDYELKALHEEFQHHQEKINQYYSLLDEEHQNTMNDIDNEVNKFDFLDDVEASDTRQSDPTNTIREKHRELKHGYDRLHKMSSTGPDSKEFVEPKVSGLWKLATRADFTQQELESLHTELKHYEKRMLKVRHLSEQMGKENSIHADEKIAMGNTAGQEILEERYAKQKRKVEKLHEDLEMRILARHSEL